MLNILIYSLITIDIAGMFYMLISPGKCYEI